MFILGKKFVSGRFGSIWVQGLLLRRIYSFIFLYIFIHLVFIRYKFDLFYHFISDFFIIAFFLQN